MVIIWNGQCWPAQASPVSCPESYLRDQIGTGPAVSWQTDAYIEFKPATRIDLFPDQTRESVQTFGARGTPIGLLFNMI